MSTFDEIPQVLQSLERRTEFIAWLQALPLPFHPRLQIYFSWIDRNETNYTPDEINNLKPVPR